jgi:hypothetical protein
VQANRGRPSRTSILAFLPQTRQDALPRTPDMDQFWYQMRLVCRSTLRQFVCLDVSDPEPLVIEAVELHGEVTAHVLSTSAGDNAIGHGALNGSTTALLPLMTRSGSPQG